MLFDSDVSSGNEVLANDHNTESTSESEEEPASAAAPEPKASLNPTATKKTRGDSIANIILEVIKDGGGKSAVSFVFIKKYLKQKYEFDNLLYIKKAMMKLLKDDVIYNKTKGNLENFFL